MGSWKATEEYNVVSMAVANSIESVAILLALQFTAFGWRITRETQVEDSHRKARLPFPDYLNIISMFCTISLVMVPALASLSLDRLNRTVLSSCFVLIAFHPISTAAHYRLFSKEGRSIYCKKGEDYPWITRQEMVSSIVSIFCSGLAGWITYMRFPGA